MPKLKGIELIENIKKYEKKMVQISTPIIILSGNLTSSELQQATGMGVKYALAKPCLIEDFERKVTEVLLNEYPDKVMYSTVNLYSARNIT